MKLTLINVDTPEGTAVLLVEDDGSITLTRTRSEVWALGSGELVVKVDGRTGGYLASRIFVAAPCFAQYEQDLETERMRLAGCGVAANDGSEEQAVGFDSPYWSSSYADVLRLRRRCDVLEGMVCRAAEWHMAPEVPDSNRRVQVAALHAGMGKVQPAVWRDIACYHDSAWHAVQPGLHITDVLAWQELSPLPESLR